MEQREGCKGKVIKGKLEETTPKRNNKNNFGNGGKGKIGSKDKETRVYMVEQ
jgi:hypothetical protein